MEFVIAQEWLAVAAGVFIGIAFMVVVIFIAAAYVFASVMLYKFREPIYQFLEAWEDRKNARSRKP